MFLELNGTVVIQLINFAIFFWILRWVFLRPVSRAITARREYINSVTSDFDTYQAKARALREQAESVRAAARRDAEQTLTKTRAEASNESAAVSTQYGQQAQQTIEAAEEEVNRELNVARADEPQMVRDLAETMLGRALEVAS
jgi:F-type H+-transporting ATPase subunit b